MKWGKRKEKEEKKSKVKTTPSRPYNSNDYLTEAGQKPHVKNESFSKGMNSALYKGDRDTFSR